MTFVRGTRGRWMAALAGAGVVAVLSWHMAHVPKAPIAGSTGGQSAGMAPVPMSSAHEARDSWPPAAPPGSAQPPEAASPLDAAAPPRCRTRSGGELVIDERTRDDIELVASLYARDEALARLDQACAHASPSARRDIRELYLQFVQYTQAVSQTFPMEVQLALPIDEVEPVLRQGLHDLRVRHFGADRACAMFCEEEAVSRRLIGLAADRMREHPHLSLEEAIGQAQVEISAGMGDQAASQGSVPR